MKTHLLKALLATLLLALGLTKASAAIDPSIQQPDDKSVIMMPGDGCISCVSPCAYLQ